MEPIVPMKDRNSTKGFTQVELLLVIAITGVMPTIITPLLIDLPHFDRITQLSKSK
jgi:Tfp pilus assembly protein FimT